MMRALRVQIVASLLAGLLTAGAAFSPVAAFAPSSVGLSRRSPMRPAGACAMTARAEIPPNVAELMEKAKLRIDETSVAVAGQSSVAFVCVSYWAPVHNTPRCHASFRHVGKSTP